MATDVTQGTPTTVTIRVRDVEVTIDTSSNTITSMSVDYDLIGAGVTTSKTWSGQPAAGLAADLWSVLSEYLAGVLATEGVTPPATPLPSAVTSPGP